MIKYGYMMLLSIVLGTLSRAFMLKIDYRQFPSYPSSYVIHLTLGMIASVLGALFLPALLEEEYIAVTFLTIGAQEFRDVRGMERDSLNSVESNELIPRGEAYIEGIAKLFEARNYIALLTALLTSILFYYTNWTIAVIVSIIASYALHVFMKGPRVKDIAEIKVVPLAIEGYNIGIDDVIIMNVGEKEALDKWKKEGIGIKVIPLDEDSRATLFNLGQRQVILHELSILMGVKLDKGLQQFTPLARLDIEYGSLNIILIPQEPDKEFIKMAVERIPVLESTQRKPLKSQPGRKAAD